MRYLIPFLTAALLSGCAAFQPAADVIARGIDEACQRGMDPLAMEARRATVAGINAATTVGNHTPSDCDSASYPVIARRVGRSAWQIKHCKIWLDHLPLRAARNHARTTIRKRDDQRERTCSRCEQFDNEFALAADANANRLFLVFAPERLD